MKRPGSKRLHLGVFGIALALSIAACGSGGGQSPVSGQPNGTPKGVATDSGTATLSWTPVVGNTNGTALTDLAGYRIYFGSSPGTLNTVVVLSNPGLTTYQVTNLSSGTWYFAVAAFASTGTEGVLSNIASKTVP